jgi:hypothetical protein
VAWKYHSTGIKVLASGARVRYRICSQKHDTGCPATMQEDLESGKQKKEEEKKTSLTLLSQAYAPTTTSTTTNQSRGTSHVFPPKKSEPS